MHTLTKAIVNLSIKVKNNLLLEQTESFPTEFIIWKLKEYPCYAQVNTLEIDSRACKMLCIDIFIKTDYATYRGNICCREVRFINESNHTAEVLRGINKGRR